MFVFIPLSIGIIIGYSISRYPFVARGFKSFVLRVCDAHSEPVHLQFVSVPKDFLQKGKLTYSPVSTGDSISPISKGDTISYNISELSWIPDEKDPKRILVFQPSFMRGAKNITVCYEGTEITCKHEVPADSWWSDLMSMLFKPPSRIKRL